MVMILILAFTACSEQDETQRPEFSQPTFYLSELPELAPFEIPPEIISRYGGIDFNDKLKPADDYGQLYPFEGKRIRSDYWTSSRYGLVDAYGRIVVDPVYESAQYIDADATYLFLTYPPDRIDPEVVDIWEVMDEPRSITIAKADGSWVKEGFWGNWATLSEDRFILTTYAEMAPRSYAIYDLEGRLLSEEKGFLSEFSEGLGAVSFAGYSSDGRSMQRSWYVDRNGNTVIPGPFLDARNFTDGKAVVSIGDDWENARFGIIDTEGNFLLEPARENAYLAHSMIGQAYFTFSEGGDPALDGFDRASWRWGIRDRDNNIIVPAEYRFIHLPLDSETALAQEMESGEYFLIRLPDGDKRFISNDGANVYMLGSEWVAVDHRAGISAVWSDDGGMLALIKEDEEHWFDYEPGQVISASWIEGDLIAINYHDFSRYSRQDGQNLSRADIFDGSSGEIIKSLNGWSYSYNIGDRLRMFNHSEAQRVRVFDRNFAPQFPNETADFVWLNQITEGMFQVSTTFSSGLLRENGEWLVRVNLSSVD